MADENSKGAEPVLDPSHRRRLRWPPTPARWLLLILFVGLQIADVVSTNYALAIPGNMEGNPIMAFSQAHLGAAWWLPKMLLAGFAVLTAPRWRRRWPVVCAVLCYALIVACNLTSL